MGRRLTRSVPLLFVLLIAMGRASAQAAPLIDTISPASGAPGTKVTIVGRGFTADNTVVFGKARIAHVKIASAVAITCTTNPNCRPGIRQRLEFPVPRSQHGRVKVSVTNAGGSSNAVDFDVLN